MADAKIDIGSYGAYQGEESPRVFFAHGEKITVLEVLKMWTEETGPNRRLRRFFVVQGSDGFLHTLYYDLDSGGWFYRGFERDRSRRN